MWNPFDNTARVLNIFTKLLARLERIEKKQVAKQVRLSKKLEASVKELGAAQAFKANLKALTNVEAEKEAEEEDADSDS